MKKRKLNYKNICITLVVFIIIIWGIVALFFSKSLKIDFDNVINYGTEYKINYKAFYKRKDVTNDIKLEGNIDTKKIGTYKVDFIYKNDEKEYKITKKIKVKDISGPVITLNETEQRIPINQEFKDSSYKAIDNYDGDITGKVKVSGKVDTSKEGVYELIYTVKDSYKNESKVIKKVTVTKDTPLNMSVKDFTLNGFFTNSLLKETSDLGSSYSDEFIFMGDSVALYYVVNGQIPGTRLWHKEGVSPESALSDSIYINHMETGKTFVENISIKKPKKAIMTLGSNSVAYMEPSYFIKKYKELLIKMKEASPDTLIIIQSIPPVSKKTDETSKLTNDKINKLNYYILEMCNELLIPFLNSAEALKDSQGHLKEGYYITDGIHLSKSGNEKLMKYLQNHAYEKK